MSAFTFQRRSLLAGAGGAALLAGTGALSGCSTGAGPDTNTAAKNTAVTLPTYVQFTGIKPDLPGSDKGVDPAFRNFPKDRPKVVPEKPGNGETLTGMGNIYYAVPPGPDRNSYWAGLNERLGIDLDLQMVGNADYTQKFATTIAGNDLPDMLQMQVVANFPALLEKRFTRLDEFLSGDAIKEYPNLANIPTRHWKPAVYNGGIYGIPIPRGAVGAYSFIREDLFDAAGLSPEPKSFAELTETAKALTDPKKRRWAFGMWGQVRNYLTMMNGAPTGWREEGGKLTHQYETEEYKQAITDLTELWKAGVLHPDAFSDQLPFKNLFNAGTVAINATDGYPGWTQYILDNASNPNFKLGLMPVYQREGGELAAWHQGSGYYSITALKKQDSPDKIKLILRVLNWLAAPFGTEEYLYRLYGEEGVDHTVNADGDPVLTKTGTANTVIPIRYMADSPYTIYQPGRPEDADTQHAYQTKVLEKSITNPTVGLFSNTHATKNATIDKTFNDGVQQIIQGRDPFSKLDELIKAWRTGGGDGMRAEYEEQLQQAGGQPG
ncbi:type 2 periplasmic-binding domain-containing protein [Microlunatus parietis]|uniref:Putative aldouronate transport system substrate-binding protein n=1 Tax=Microlunatus parietis TaxID=682979 RepID=A0A7Y9ID53_9ACTN|nr:extracellular solute-binding protein [Microlunatus parietis]NYE74652.1 putative aldouronate transport system substrate-binding protein [Microlunatus parietis]